jgi:hypothetical protein
MEAIQGSRIKTGSLNSIPQNEKDLDPMAYEAKITGLFSPYLAFDIEDGEWANMQTKSGVLIGDIIRHAKATA